MMIPRIETIPEKKLIGKNLIMSLTDNKTFQLFSNFMPKRKEIINTVTNDIFDLKVYSETHFSVFNPSNSFIKWAMVEVSDFEILGEKYKNNNSNSEEEIWIPIRLK